MRIIDADELKKMFPDKGEGAWTYNITAKAYIDAQPTVDLWHYIAKGELPDKDVECLVHTIGGNYFIAMIDSSDNCWCTGEFFSEYLRDDCVVRWQYIVPPKEEV